MTNLLDFYSGTDGEPTPTLSEMRLGPEPAMALLFTASGGEARLHYIKDEGVRSYVVCPGTGCPLCYCGTAPIPFHLLPVFDVESGVVKVLRIPTRRQPGGLGPLLVPHLRDEKIVAKVILISRNDFKYTVEARSLAANAKRGDPQIKAFIDDCKAGLTLESAFPRMTPEELAEVPTVSAKLEALGGWLPPAAAEPEEPPTRKANNTDEA